MGTPTKSVQKGLDEFSKEQCLKAIELHEQGKVAKVVVGKILPTKVGDMSKGQIRLASDRLINTGRYLKYSFTKNLDD